MSSIQAFARIRPSLCWEQQNKSLQVINNSIGIAPNYNSNIIKPIVNFYQFQKVFEEDSKNK